MGQKNTQIVIGIVGGVIVIALIVIFMFGGGGGEGPKLDAAKYRAANPGKAVTLPNVSMPGAQDQQNAMDLEAKNSGAPPPQPGPGQPPR